MTTEEFLEQSSSSPDLSEPHRLLLREFLRHADLVKFAGWRPDAQVVGTALASTERFLEETHSAVVEASHPSGGRPKKELTGA